MFLVNYGQLFRSGTLLPSSASTTFSHNVVCRSSTIYKFDVRYGQLACINVGTRILQWDQHSYCHHYDIFSAISAISNDLNLHLISVQNYCNECIFSYFFKACQNIYLTLKLLRESSYKDCSWSNCISPFQFTVKQLFTQVIFDVMKTKLLEFLQLWSACIPSSFLTDR